MQNELNHAFALVAQGSNTKIKEGEAILNRLKMEIVYPLALLQYMRLNELHPDGQLRAAIELRIWCEKFKTLEAFERKEYAQVLDQVKTNILMSYLQFSLKVSKTIRSGIICIADVDFPDNWPQLLPYLLSTAHKQPTTIKPILKLLGNITDKYGHLSRSDPLYHEIIVTCDAVHDFLLSLTVNVLDNLSGNLVPDSIQILTLLMTLFYNLNYQDLHPKFEDSLTNWMQILKQVMSLKNTSEAIFKCKGAALESILLYASKYREDVEDAIKGFCQQIWELCAGATEDVEYDQIVFSSLKFFKSLILWNDMKQFFKNHMDELLMNLILPHIGINKKTLSLFNEQIGLFVDYYFRNIQLQTRRAAALELMRVICRHYDSFEPFLQNQVQNYQQIANKNVNAECTILNLIIDGGCKGFREIDGCTSLFINQQFVTFSYSAILKPTLSEFYQFILANPNKHLESAFNLMHITTILRFLFYFRVYVPQNQLTSIVQFLCAIKTQSESLRVIQQLTLNGYIGIRHGDFMMYSNLVPYFNEATLKEVALNVLGVIYEWDLNESVLNQNVSKLLYTLIRNLGQSNGLYAEATLNVMKSMLKKTAQFDFASVAFLFESIGTLAFWMIKRNSAKQASLEEVMMSFFKVQLSNQSDLLNFCFQIFCVFIKLTDQVAPHYTTIYQSILDSSNWSTENSSVMSAYIQYVSVYLEKAVNRLLIDRPAYEVVLSKLIAMQYYELFYRFLESVLKSIGWEGFVNSGYITLALQGSEAVINTSATARKHTLLFFCKLVNDYDPKNVSAFICVNGFFQNLLKQSHDIIQSMQTRKERKCMFNCICQIIVRGYFSSPETEGVLLNLLVENISNRFNFGRLTEQVAENEQREKKEATYRKLQIFKQMEANEPEIVVDEEVLLQTQVVLQWNSSLQKISRKWTGLVKSIPELDPCCSDVIQEKTWFLFVGQQLMIYISREHYQEVLELLRFTQHNLSLIHPSKAIESLTTRFQFSQSKLDSIYLQLASELDDLRASKNELQIANRESTFKHTQCKEQNTALLQANTMHRAELAKILSQNLKLKETLKGWKEQTRQKMKGKEEALEHISLKARKYKKMAMELRESNVRLERRVAEFEGSQSAQELDDELGKLEEELERLEQEESAESDCV